MCDKVVNASPFEFVSVPDQYMPQELCDKVISEDFFMSKYCHDKYKSQEICDEAADSYLQALNFCPDWHVTNKMIGKLDSTVIMIKSLIHRLWFCYILFTFLIV